MDVYVVLDGDRLVGVSATRKGAGILRSNHAETLADFGPNQVSRKRVERVVYERQQIEIAELQDAE